MEGEGGGNGGSGKEEERERENFELLNQSSFIRAGLGHVRGVRPNRAADFIGGGGRHFGP